MTELLITLMNAPRVVQRSVAVGILALMVIVVGFIASALVSVLSEKSAHVAELRGELYRLDQVIARKPSASKAEPSSIPEQLFIQGNSVSVIQAALQERLNSVSATSGATVASMSGTPIVQINGATYVGLRADFDGDLRAVHEVIQQLETSLPPLIIRKALIRSNNTYPQGRPSEPIHLSAQISVYGAADPSMAAAHDGGKP